VEKKFRPAGTTTTPMKQSAKGFLLDYLRHEELFKGKRFV
jgi:hypothetical protein